MTSMKVIDHRLCSYDVTDALYSVLAKIHQGVLSREDPPQTAKPHPANILSRWKTAGVEYYRFDHAVWHVTEYTPTDFLDWGEHH